MGTEAGAEGRRHLDLGCGSSPRNPYRQAILYGIDIRHGLHAPGVEAIVAANLALQAIPFPDSHFDSVSAYDFLEHIPRVALDAASASSRLPFIELMNEIWRVLKPDGLFYAATPVFSHEKMWRDPTHVNPITPKSCRYFTRPELGARMYGFTGDFEVVRQTRCRFKREYEPARLPVAGTLARWLERATGQAAHLVWEWRALKPAPSALRPQGMVPHSSAPAGLDRVTLVIVSHHSAHCVAALAAQLNRCPHIVVVDNASHDDTLARFQRLLPQAQLIANPQNLGFGAANNQALARVQTPFALLLNPDCEITESAIVALVDAADHSHPDAAVLAPQLLDRHGRPTLNYGWPRHLWAARGPGAEGPCCVGAACGAVLLLRLAALRAVGHFDTGFFLYYEDDDLCARLLAAKRPIVLLPEVRVAHRSRGSTRSPTPWRTEYGRGFHHAQSKLRYSAKYAGLARARSQRRRWLALAALGLLVRLLLPVPRLLARALGRVLGLWRWQAASVDSPRLAAPAPQHPHPLK